MRVSYPGGQREWDVPDGSRVAHDPERARLWVLEPDDSVRSFAQRVEFVVQDDQAAKIRDKFFPEFVAALSSPVPAEPVEAPEPWVILPKEKYYRKHHSRVGFFGKYERSIPVGSRFKVTPRGVIVVTPLGRVKLYTPLGLARLTAAEEALLAASVPRNRRSL
ncbi:hypothetical protein [Rathayibacter sp. AY1H2]|uniref:hypothetical protein n=1 Tax=Rathayibacter sp. AY1H2 TaxID=2080566 RepID=UPI0011B0942E|nr:hypothetical protein [Rathayibacter sp. AY1H2]